MEDLYTYPCMYTALFRPLYVHCSIPTPVCTLLYSDPCMYTALFRPLYVHCSIPTPVCIVLCSDPCMYSALFRPLYVYCSISTPVCRCVLIREMAKGRFYNSSRHTSSSKGMIEMVPFLSRLTGPLLLSWLLPPVVERWLS